MRRARDERGATMVEAAIVTPLFFLLIFGVIEGGLLFRTYLTAVNASRDAARVATVSDNRAYTDWEILQSVAKGTAAVSRSDFVRVVVFLGNKTDGNKSPVPAGCTDGVAVADVCNVYDASDLALTRAQFGAAGYTKDDNWRGTTRDYNLSGSGPEAGTDYVGVQIVLRHNAVTGALGTTRDLAVTTVMRLEPMEAV